MSIDSRNDISNGWAKVRDGLGTATHRAAEKMAPVVQSGGERAVYAIQRTEVALQRVDRRPLALSGTALLALAILAAIIFGPLTPTRAPQAASVAPSTEITPQAFSIERVSHGRNGNIFALVGGAPLFPLSSRGLKAMDGLPVEMQGVPVHSIVSDNGMWVGESADQRVFVTLSQTAMANGMPLPSTYKPGDRLNLSGRIAPLAGLEQLGVSPDEGAEQLFRQNRMVEAVSLRPPTLAPSYR